MTAYIGLMRKERGSDFGVEFPDFPGCVTAGRTLEEARHMAAEALSLHLEGLIADGASIPPARSLDAIMADPAHAGAVALLVDVPAAPARSVRVNITLPADLVAAIDRASTNRSRFLAEAARSKLHDAA